MLNINVKGVWQGYSTETVQDWGPWRSIGHTTKGHWHHWELRWCLWGGGGARSFRGGSCTDWTRPINGRVWQGVIQSPYLRFISPLPSSSHLFTHFAPFKWGWGMGGGTCHLSPVATPLIGKDVSWWWRREWARGCNYDTFQRPLDYASRRRRWYGDGTSR